MPVASATADSDDDGGSESEVERRNHREFLELLHEHNAQHMAEDRELARTVAEKKKRQAEVQKFVKNTAVDEKDNEKFMRANRHIERLMSSREKKFGMKSITFSALGPKLIVIGSKGVNVDLFTRNPSVRSEMLAVLNQIGYTPANGGIGTMRVKNRFHESVPMAEFDVDIETLKLFRSFASRMGTYIEAAKRKFNVNTFAEAMRANQEAALGKLEPIPPEERPIEGEIGQERARPVVLNALRSRNRDSGLLPPKARPGPPALGPADARESRAARAAKAAKAFKNASSPKKKRGKPAGSRLSSLSFRSGGSDSDADADSDGSGPSRRG